MSDEELLAVFDSITPAPEPFKPENTDVVTDADLEALVKESVVQRPPPTQSADDEVDEQMEAMGLHHAGRTNLVEKNWMKYHKFVAVQTLDEVRQIVDACLAAGSCSLDTETQGLDTRIDFIDGKPQTKHKIVGYCISYDGETGYYIPVRHWFDDKNDEPNLNVTPTHSVEAEIARLCQASQPVLSPEETDTLSGKNWTTPPRVVIYFWNAKFDQEMLYPVTGLDYWHPDSFEDGQLAIYVYNPNEKNLSLKDQAPALLKDPDGQPYEMIELEDLFVRGRSIEAEKLSPEEIRIYGASDSICTYRLCKHPIPQEVFKNKKYYYTYRLEKQVSCVIRVMERYRMQVDVDEISKLIEEAETEATELLRKIREVAKSRGFHDFNPSSGKQIGDLLFSEQGLNLENKPEKTENGQYKTGKDTLEKLVEDLPDSDATDNVLVWIVKHKQIEKVKSTYLDNMKDNGDENNCLRFQFYQCGAATGRFSAPSGSKYLSHGFSGVPIHGIPARNDPKKPHCANSLRKMFKARDGYTLVKCDYAGQELRIVANVSKEPLWIKEFLEGDGDLHTITARILFGKQEVTKDERAKGKAFNFAVVYGGGQAAIMRILGCDKTEAYRRKNNFDKGLSVFASWVQKQQSNVMKDLGITNNFGRWIPIPDAGSPIEALVASAKRCACNYPIQSAGADIMKISLVLLHRELSNRGWLKNGDDSVRMLLTVHDEVVFEVRHDRVAEAVPLIVEIMERPGKNWQVPLVVEPLIGLHWDGKYDWAHMRKGRPAKPAELAGEVPKGWELVGNRVYQKVPEWLEGKLSFDRGGSPGGSPPPAPIPAAPPTPAQPPLASPVAAPTQATSSPAQVVQPKMALVQPTVPGYVLPPSWTPPVRTYALAELTDTTVKLVCDVCVKTRDNSGSVLKLVDPDGAVLIDPTLDVRVNPTLFEYALRAERNVHVIPLATDPS
jgi:DNA polymerase I-like protein with 3'-5' exonuclease and polymerase domains